MIKIAKQLALALKTYGYSKEASWIDLLLKYAGYDDEWREKIEELALKNKYPFKEWFGGQKRIYLPFKSEVNSNSVPIDENVESILEQSGYQITDYVGGYCVRDGRTYRIGKILNSLRDKEIKNLKDTNSDPNLVEQTERKWKDIINQFNNSKFRTNKKFQNKLMVVFSQDPHDVAKMSYERDWTSCMTLGQGSQHENVFCEVKEGGFVAYLITDDDLEIKKPLARIHIRRFTNPEGVSFAKVEDSVYGNETAGFKTFVEDWVSKNNQKRFQETKTPRSGLFRLRGGTYSDTFQETEVVPPEEKEELIEWFRNPPELSIKRWLFTDTLYEYGDEDYWNEIYNLENYEGKKEFDTLAEAENFKRYIINQDYLYDYEWITDFLDEETIEAYREEGILDEKIDELLKERFKIEKTVDTYEKEAKERAARDLVLKYGNSLDSNLANELLEFFIDRNTGSNYQEEHCVEILYKAFPSLLTDERFLDAGSSLKKRLMDHFDTENPKLYDRLYHVLNKSIQEMFDINGEHFNNLIKDAKVSSNYSYVSSNNDHLSTARSIAFSLRLSFSNLKSLPLSPNSMKAIEKFLYEDLPQHKEFSFYNETLKLDNNSLFSTVYDAALSYLIPKNLSPDHLEFAMNLIKNAWPHVDLTKWEGESGLNVHIWLFSLTSLKANAKVFLPQIKEIYNQAREHVLGSKGMKVVYKFDNSYVEKEVKKRERRVLYVLDCIENNTNYSKKYKWYEN